MISYLLASLEYFLYLVYRKPGVSTMATATVVIGLLSHTAIIGLRSQETGHGPYTTSFEVAVFLSWLVVVVYCFTHWRYKIKGLGIVCPSRGLFDPALRHFFIQGNSRFSGVGIPGFADVAPDLIHYWVCGFCHCVWPWGDVFNSGKTGKNEETWYDVFPNAIAGIFG